MLRTLAKDSAIYAVGTVLSRLVGFVMIPIYTRVLSPAEYGIIETVLRSTDVFSMLLALGIGEALLRYYHEPASFDDRKVLVSTSLWIVTLLSFAGTLILLPLAPVLARLVFGHTGYVYYIRLAIIVVLVGNLQVLPMTLLRATGKASVYTLFSVLQLATALTLNIVLVVWLKKGVSGVFLSGILSPTIWSVCLISWCLYTNGWKVSIPWTRRLCAYGAPLVPTALAQFIIHYSDRLFLTRAATIQELGVYSLAYRFSMLVSVFFSVIGTAWWPWIFKTMHERHAGDTIRRAATGVMAAGFAICSGIILLSKPVIHTMAARPFWHAAQYVPPVSVAYWFFILTNPFSVPLRTSSRTDRLARANTIAAVTCLVLSFALIPRFGVWGAIWVTTLTLALLAILTWREAALVGVVAVDLPTCLTFTLLLVALSIASVRLEFEAVPDAVIRIAVFSLILAAVALSTAKAVKSTGPEKEDPLRS